MGKPAAVGQGRKGEHTGGAVAAFRVTKMVN